MCCTRRRSLRLLLLYFLVVALHAAHAAPSWLQRGTDEGPALAQPAENLLLIVADIQRHLADDIYRFPYPVDANGQNVFRAGIVRLSNYEKAFPGRMRDLISLAQGQAFERLCAFQEAGANYKQAAERASDDRIKTLAEDGFERMRRFSQVVDVVPDRSTPRTWERDIQTRIALLKDLIKEFQGTPYDSLLQVEKERAQMQLAQFYISMRFMRPYSMDDVNRQLKQNLEEHKNSKLLYTHYLMRADLQFDLAKQYTVLNDPEGPDFSLRDFQGFTNAAKADYSVVEQADGFDEKLEGRAKLNALDSFVERVVSRAR